jgi:protein Tex
MARQGSVPVARGAADGNLKGRYLMLEQKIMNRLAADVGVTPRQAHAALALFADGATVPFVARYRKEVTGGLDEVQLRAVEERAAYLVALEERRTAIATSIIEQGKLDDALRAKLAAADTKQALEDLYLPYKPKRRTRALIARGRGLEPLAELIWAGRADDIAVTAEAAAYVDEAKEVPGVDEALRGARDILAERVAEDAELRALVRDATRQSGVLTARGRSGVDSEASKFRDYFDFSQQLGDVPSHRILAIRRGEAEGEIIMSIDAPADEIVATLTRRVIGARAAVTQLRLVAEDAYKRLLAPSIEVELRLELKLRADEDAIGVFGANLEQLLLGAPAGERVALGLDPGYRTGVKAAVVSRTGALLDTGTLYLHQEDRFATRLRELVSQHGVELVAIGNGTASRETEALTRKVLANLPAPWPQVVVVNEAGASVYSASDVARDEFPDLDVSLRGAPSIARRLQDPLAELVKIDPRSIGVGQYQHDVGQTRLRKRLDEVVESCVNRVGVEVNTASAPLLSYVAGLGPTLARSIVELRDRRGGFRSRVELLDVPRLGAKAFEQAGGFLRVRGGEHPLDATAVHPERYALVERMAEDAGLPLAELVGNEAALARIDVRRYVSDDVGTPTLIDILDELRRPGRDPRDRFEAPSFREDVRDLSDLQPGMRLEGVVTNLVAFGAFVDVGVHQDGLVHISQIADRFVRDPAEIVKVGQRVAVTVLSVDVPRRRIALSMKTQPVPGEIVGTHTAASASQSAETSGGGRADRRGQRRKEKAPTPPKSGTVAPNGMRFR